MVGNRYVEGTKQHSAEFFLLKPVKSKSRKQAICWMYLID